ncbi:Pr6Pr family membrane protein [Curtobacterium sp. Leaf261]|uniref:Pr6Pr family membrane protein n=1 Tax=Curtobacterium sp. Leaf261 TaxID=1736311 RepID=UPI0006FDFC47|nr:Pr6Pr family membrane protein [Curtobacterium sp. Leaf261]KQO63002.1 hypothetical protein ASF23_08955 [Curtobacterium sp. Leaf261]
MSTRVAVIILRLVMAALSIAGSVTQFTITVIEGHSIANFFSYFTILGNIFAAIVFIVGAARLVRSPTGEVLPAVRGASVLYMVFVGAVFNTLLVGADLGDLQPWINVVHHMLMPLVVVVDWLVWPPRGRVTMRTMWWWMVPVAAYVVYTLVRGPIVGFYPYPFFNPAAVGGYGGVTLYCVAMLVGFVVLAFLVRWSGNALGARRWARGR